MVPYNIHQKIVIVLIVFYLTIYKSPDFKTTKRQKEYDHQTRNGGVVGMGLMGSVKLVIFWKLKTLKLGK